MAKKTVYLETTIPSFYCETRTEPQIFVRTVWTKEWWDAYRMRYTIVSSEAVLDELEASDYPSKTNCLKLMTEVPLLPIDHPANANKFEQIRLINTMLGLFVPSLVTPLELLGKEEPYEE